MNNLTYCTADPDQGDRYLYLPCGWNAYPWIATGHTVLNVQRLTCRSRLFLLAHGPIWFDYPRMVYWRIIMPGIYIHPDWLYPHPVTGLWTSMPEHLPINAERIDYETLRLEAVFGYSVWGGS